MKYPILTAAFSVVFVSAACHTVGRLPSTPSPSDQTAKAAPLRPSDPFESFDPFDPFDPFEPLAQTDPTAPVDSEVWDVSDVDISDVDPARKLISFTFDDAPGKTLENILAVFAAFNESNPDCKASATVFCNGHLIDNSAIHTLHNACALGFELGNHSYSHPNLVKLSASEIQEELDRTDELLYRVDGKARHLFRAPFGSVNDEVKAVVSTPVLDWTIDTVDWKGVSVEEIYNAVWSQKYAGAIVLMHDGYKNTVEALKRLLPDLKKEGYQVVSVSAMAKAHDCPLRRGRVYIRARKNGVGK